MRALPVLIVAGALLAGASTAMAQPGAPDTGATGAYAGAGPHGFYDIDARMDRIQQSIAALPHAKARRATSALKAIRADLKYRKARHNGELRDWDREHVSDQLDKLVAQYGLKG